MDELPLRFGTVELRPQQRRLLVEGRPQVVGARAFDLLLALVERHERVVTKGELLDLVWPGMVVEESNLPVHVSALRKLLGGGAITTIPGRGYRFTLAPESEGDAAHAPATPPAVAPPIPQPVAGAAAAPAESVPGRFEPPADAEPIIGREEAVYEIVAALIEHRLVDIVGAGGMGKTRLARAVLRRLREDFVDGVWWVDLAPLQHPEQVVRAIAQSLGEPLGPGDGPELLARALARRSRLLLVLDNCEQVADSVASVVATLLADLPPLRLLLTSRVPLHLAAEQVWRLEGLPVPAVGATLAEARACGAFELFELRAHASDQRFAIASAHLPLAIELCRRLEGHPLAIEMAAARAPQIGMGPLLNRLGERLRLLRSTDPTLPERQLSLRAMLDWSCSQLDVAQRTVLRRLAVFVGSFGLDAAQQVVADADLDEWAVLDALAALVDHSLVQVQTDHDPAAAVQADALVDTWMPRYRLAETTRLYAGEQLGAADEAEATALRHRLALAQVADAAAQAYWGVTQARWLARYGSDQDDLQIAFEAACAGGDAHAAARIGQALAALEATRGQGAGAVARRSAARALLPLAVDPRTAALLWNLMAPAESLEQPGQAELKDSRARVAAWRGVGDAQQLYLAWRDLALVCARDGLDGDAAAAMAAMTELEDPRWSAALRIEGAQVHAELRLTGTNDAGREGLQRALDLAEQLGDGRRVAWLRFRLAEWATAEGLAEDAVRWGDLAVSAVEPLQRPFLLGFAWRNLCAAWLFLGDDAAARRSAAEAYPLLQSSPYGATVLPHIALLTARAGHPLQAAQLLGHALQSCQSLALVRRARILERLWSLTTEAMAVASGPKAKGRMALDEIIRSGQRPMSDAQADVMVRRVLQGPDASGPAIP